MHVPRNFTNRMMKILRQYVPRTTGPLYHTTSSTRSTLYTVKNLGQNQGCSSSVRTSRKRSINFKGSLFQTNIKCIYRRLATFKSTKRKGCTGRISALGLFRTDLTTLGPYCQDLGRIFAQYSPCAWLIRCINCSSFLVLYVLLVHMQQNSYQQ